MKYTILTEWAYFTIPPAEACMSALCPVFHKIHPKIKSCNHLNSVSNYDIKPGDLLMCEIECEPSVLNEIESDGMGVRLCSKEAIKLSNDVYQYCQNPEVKKIIETGDAAAKIKALRSHIDKVKCIRKKEVKSSPPRYGLHELP